MKGKVLYQERDGFRGTFVWYTMMAVTLFMLWTFGRGFYQQIMLGEPWGNNPMSDSTLIVVFISTVVFIVIIFIIVDIHKLEIQVDEGGIRYKFFPYFRSFRTVHKEQIKEIYVRKYRPIMEYGGWGYRLGFARGRAYNIRGRWGLQLTFKDGKKLLLGTQKPIELDKVIDQVKTKWGII